MAQPPDPKQTEPRDSEQDGKKDPCEVFSEILAELDSPPPPEEQLGGGDICSLEQEPSTEDDKPLD